MTRINLVDPSALHHKHLVAEYREIVRVFALVRNAQYKPVQMPKEYTLGTGHVKFFYDKLGFILSRYQSLVSEMQRRGYNPNPISSAKLTNGIDSRWFGGYSPTPQAVQINKQRILERMPK